MSQSSTVPASLPQNPRLMPLSDLLAVTGLKKVTQTKSGQKIRNLSKKERRLLTTEGTPPNGAVRD
jgi:hypothetical protein